MWIFHTPTITKKDHMLSSTFKMFSPKMMQSTASQGVASPSISTIPSHYEQITDVLRNDMVVPLSKQGFNPYMEIDIAVENGQTDDAKEIHKKHNVLPSLYAKQMALVNGFPATNLWVDTIGVRNQTGIDIVHQGFDKNKRFGWSSAIPEQFQFSR